MSSTLQLTRQAATERTPLLCIPGTYCSPEVFESIDEATIFPLTLSAAGRVSRQISGPAIAMVATCGYVGFLAGPAAIGLATNVVNLRLAFGLVVVLSLCAAALANVVGIKSPADGPLLTTDEPSLEALSEFQ